MNIKILLAHGCSLHTEVSVVLPLQTSASQKRVLVLLPPLQETLHGDQLDHKLYLSSSTRKRAKDIINLYDRKIASID